MFLQRSEYTWLTHSYTQNLTHRHTYSHTSRQNHKHSQGHSHGHSHTHTHRHTDTHTQRHTDKHTHRETHRHTNRDTQTHTHTLSGPTKKEAITGIMVVILSLIRKTMGKVLTINGLLGWINHHARYYKNKRVILLSRSTEEFLQRKCQ